MRFFGSTERRENRNESLFFIFISAEIPDCVFLSQAVFFYPKLCFPFHCFRSLLPRLQPQLRLRLRLRLMAKSLAGKSNCGKKVMGTYWGSERMIFFVSVRKEEEELEALKKFSFLVFVFLGDCVIKLCLISYLNQWGCNTDKLSQLDCKGSSYFNQSNCKMAALSGTVFSWQWQLNFTSHLSKACQVPAASQINVLW